MSDSQARPTEDRTRVMIPIRVKLLAALVVPLVAVAILCFLQITQARDHVAEVEAQTALARVALSPDGLVNALIVEQADATVTSLSLRETATIPTKDWTESTAATDTALAAFREGLEESGPVAEALFAETLEGIETDIQALRADAERMMEEPGLANLVPVLDELYPAYSATITQLIEANDELADAISDPEMRRAAQTLNAVNGVHFRVSGLMSSVGTSILRPGNEGRDPVVARLNDFERAVVNLRSQTDGPWRDAAEAFAENDRFQQIIDRGRDFLETNEIDLDAYIQLNPPVEDRDTAPIGTTQYVANVATEELSSMIDAQLDEARAEERRYTLLAIGTLVVATAAALLVARSIIRPMRKLTEQAEEMASTTLPAAVTGILETPPDQDVVLPTLAPVSVKSRDELQTVATAINHVQASALDLAVEQATLRRNIADSFVSLGRRTQNLISLQLEQITNLEADEADPAVLESLYRLDHLATRARRNAESLVVLGGTASQQAGGAPVAMADVVRAMLSEVEAYQRVDIAGVDDAFVSGSAAADVIHLLAELVENGLSFSPPDTEVRVEGHTRPDGYALTISDDGVGMTAERLAQANKRLADNESFTVAPSRYLGHYVTGKLAGRVGARASLASGAGGGIVATVFLPSSALVDAQRSEASEVDDRPTGPPVDHEAPIDHDIKVDGRPPAVVNPTPAGRAGNRHDDGRDQRPPILPKAPSAPVQEAAGPTVPVGALPPAAAAQDKAPGDVTGAGLRKRVPGTHAQAVRERSPLLRSAAARAADQAPLGAETTPQAAENLASLLSDYTSGLERGREVTADSSTTDREPSE